MNFKTLLTGELTLGLRIRSALVHKTYATVAKDEPLDITAVDTQPTFGDEEFLVNEKTLDRMRNKSRLAPQHHNILNQKRPYKDDSLAKFHGTVAYQRRMLGRFGFESIGAKAGMCWPSKTDIAELKEYEQVAYPHSIQESWTMIAEKKKNTEEKRRLRDEDVAAKMAMTEKWINELKARLAKKEAQIAEAKERKERLIEEVRRHFGFKVDPRDERFKEMLTQKEKEDKKRKKAAKKQARADKLLAALSTGNANSAGKEMKTKSDAETPADIA